MYCAPDTETIQISRKEFERLRDAVSDLQRFATDQTAINKRLIDANEEVKEENLQLKVDNLHRKEEIENLLERNGKLKAENLALKTGVQKMEADMKNLNSEVKRQRELIQDLQLFIHVNRQEKDQNELKTQPQKDSSLSAGRQYKRSIHVKSALHKRHTDSTVAFLARMTQAYEDNLGVHQNLIFEDVVTNYGLGYNNHQGVFIAPVSGLYLITASILSRQNTEFWAALTVNGTEITRMNGRGTEGRHGTGAQTIVLFLKRGDDVSVQNVLHVDSFWGDRYSSFSGFLIEEFETDPSSIIG